MKQVYQQLAHYRQTGQVSRGIYLPGMIAPPPIKSHSFPAILGTIPWVNVSLEIIKLWTILMSLRRVLEFLFIHNLLGRFTSPV